MATSRYTADGKRKSSQTHATRSWTCPCGRTVHGNGGKAGHKSACRTYKEQRVASLERTVAEMATDEWGKGMRPALVAELRQARQLELDALRADLGLDPPATV
jgi:hypothetical protein